MAVSTVELEDAARLADGALFAAHRVGQPSAREALIQRFLPLARKLAMRYSYTDEPVEDLVQVAYIGLVKAVDRFDSERGHSFASFAVPTIVGELKRHFRDTGWSLHVPRALQERARAVSREGERLARDLGRSPTLRELAAALDWPYDDVLEATEAAHSYHSASLDAPVGHDEDEGATLGDSIGCDDGGFSLAESRQAVSAAWDCLPALERHILVLRFRYDLPQRRIAEIIGYSQMHVSRLLHRGLEKLLSAADT